jgi:hypothetical protein
MANDGPPIAFGRTAEDPDRLSAIDHDRRLPVGELVDRIAAAAAAYRLRLIDVTDAALDRSGIHPVRGEMSAGQVLEVFAAAHAEDHLVQLRASIGTG